MDQTITFDKSLQTRLQEYEDVFSGLSTLPYSKIQSEWAYYLELTLDPNGWQAMWKIPRLKCEELKIPFPTVVLTYVLNVDYPDLAALIRILAVQDDIHLPERHHVPLTQLWPTRQQDKSIALNMNSTANVLDMLRFFYIHILMPWDEDEDSSDWKGAHLLSRLRLFYDLKNGNIPKPTAEHIHTLLNEARRLNSKRQQLANICDGFDSDLENTNDKNIEALIEVNVRLIEIQNEVNLLENEVFRKVILKRQESNEVEKSKDEEKAHIWVICKEVPAVNYIKLLKAVEEQYSNEPMTFAPNLMAKLECANSNDIILLSSSKHIVRNEGALIQNFSIKGIEGRENVEILSLADDVMFDFIGESSIIENVTFNCKNTQCAILIRKGHVTLKNCTLVGDNSSTTHQGILLLNGAKLSLVSCDISGFSMAVIGNVGSAITVTDTTIHNVRSGLKIYDNCVTSICRSTIRDCKDFGIIIETEQDLAVSDQAVGNLFAVLDVVQHVTADSLNGSNNGKGDVIIKRYKIEAMENLFENPDLDPTILEDSDEEMETSQRSNLNDTVLEAPKRQTVDISL